MLRAACQRAWNQSSHKVMTAHHFTVDVEEYFQVSALEPYVSRDSWLQRESRVERSVDVLLELLDRFGSRGTFFVLGWIAKHHPQVVESIAAAGHEVASHGWGHRRVTQLNPREFRQSVRDSKQLLEDLIGKSVTGYRAPSFSIVRGGEWALDILVEEGYGYDSSLFPVRRPGYGYAGGQRAPYWIDRPPGRLVEVPPATLRIGGVNVPAAGGAYFRLFPYRLCRAALRQSQRRGAPGTFYIHPWEVDPQQPRLGVGFLTRLRHYGGLTRTADRLCRLLGEFSFRPIAETVAGLNRLFPVH